MITMGPLRAALAAALVSVTSTVRADDLAQGVVRGATTLALDLQLNGTLTDAWTHGVYTSLGAVARRSFGGPYVQASLAGAVGFTGGVGGSVTTRSVSVGAGAGWSFAVDRRSVLSPGLVASAQWSAYDMSDGGAQNFREVRVGVQVPLLVRVSERVFVEPYVVVERRWTTGNYEVSSLEASFGTRLGLVL